MGTILQHSLRHLEMAESPTDYELVGKLYSDLHSYFKRESKLPRALLISDEGFNSIPVNRISVVRHKDVLEMNYKYTYMLHSDGFRGMPDNGVRVQIKDWLHDKSYVFV